MTDNQGVTPAHLQNLGNIPNQSHQTDAELEKLKALFIDAVFWQNVMLKNHAYNVVGQKMWEKVKPELEAYIEAERLEARIDELEQLQTYWFNYSVTVPRETTTPKPVKEHIKDRLKTLDSIRQQGETNE